MIITNPIVMYPPKLEKEIMNKLKEILKEGWDVYPKWLWALNGFAIAMAFIIILFV